MNILLLEDRGDVAIPLQESLEEEGYTVFRAVTPSEATTYWEKEKIDCLIIDLNMEPSPNFTAEEIKNTFGVVLTGWVWLKKCVFNQDESMKKQTIILTAYLKTLRENVPKKELKDISIISKKSPNNVELSIVIAKVKRIEDKIKNELGEKNN